MNFYQVDILNAVIGRLRELIHEHNADENTLIQLRDAGEIALKTHTEDAYNTFMSECGSAFAGMKVSL